MSQRLSLLSLHRETSLAKLWSESVPGRVNSKCEDRGRSQFGVLRWRRRQRHREKGGTGSGRSGQIGCSSQFMTGGSDFMVNVIEATGTL